MRFNPITCMVSGQLYLMKYDYIFGRFSQIYSVVEKQACCRNKTIFQRAGAYIFCDYGIHISELQLIWRRSFTF